MENLNIALVHEWLTNVAGSERVLLSFKNVFPKAPIYTSVFEKKKSKPFAEYEVIPSFLQKIPFMKSKRELLVPFTPFAFEQFDLSQYDIVISNTSMAAKGVITKPNTLHVSYCNTPPRYLWEPHVDPRAKKGRFSWIRKRVTHEMRMWDRLAADRVDYFLANSNYVANRIKKYYQREAIVVYPPVDIDRFSLAEEQDIKDYFLFVSRLVNYKQCDLIVDAFNNLGLPLKIIGTGPDEKRLKAKSKRNIEFLSFLPDEEVKKYYQEAKAFIFASEEDFGIVPVEAMASGRPVIAYAQGGTAETVIDGKTGILFDTQTSESLELAVKRFKVEDYDPKVIRTHAEKFSKERFEKELLEVVIKLYKKFKE